MTKQELLELAAPHLRNKRVKYVAIPLSNGIFLADGESGIVSGELVDAIPDGCYNLCRMLGWTDTAYA